MKKKSLKEIVEDRAIDACASYLRSKGWSIAVGGFSQIEQGTLKYNFKLVFSFTGKPPKSNP